MTHPKTKLNKIHVKQIGEYSCGLACISALTNYYNGPVSQEKLREISGTTLNGTSMLGLFQAAEKIGFDVTGYEGDIKNLKLLDHPVILHVVVDGKQQHYVVCYNYENEKFTIGDPAWGITYYSESELDAIWQSKALLSLSPNQNFQTQQHTSASMLQWFKSLIKEDTPILSVAIVIGVVMAVMSLSTAIFSQKLIDEFLPNNDTEKIVIGLSALAILLCARAFLGYVQGIFMAKQGMGLNIRIVKSFIDKIIKLPISYFKGYSTGDLIARLNDSRRIQSTIALVTGNVIINTLVVLVSAIYMFLMSVPMGLLSLSSIVFFIFIAKYFHGTIHDMQKEVMVAHSANESQYIDALTGISTIKSFRKEQAYTERINNVYEAYQTKGHDLAILGNRFGFVTQFTAGVYISAIFGFGVWMVLEEKILLGELMALVTVGASTIPSLAGLMVANIQLQEARVAFSRLYEISSVQKEYESDIRGLHGSYTENASTSHTLRLDNISFRFPGRTQILKNISFQVKSREVISVFGQVGSGKSTLVDLIQGFYTLESGSIKLDNKSVDHWGLSTWRAKIAVVAQTEKIFNSTLLDNICMSNDPNELQICANFMKDIGIDSFFTRLPQGYLTLCGEEGRNLSGGQKQLITIARALYKQPEFLVLDESTSAMDFDTESEVLHVLKYFAIKYNVGIVMITHRVGLAKQGDRILILNNGSITDSGSHEELATGQNEYARAFQSLTAINNLN